MRRGPPDRGFTLVELTVVVLVLGILVSIALIAFTANRAAAERATCFTNERNVEGLYETWRTATNGSIDPPADRAELTGYLVPAYITKEPRCPAQGGSYSWSATGSVTCAVHGRYYRPGAPGRRTV